MSNEATPSASVVALVATIATVGAVTSDRAPSVAGVLTVLSLPAESWKAAAATPIKMSCVFDTVVPVTAEHVIVITHVVCPAHAAPGSVGAVASQLVFVAILLISVPSGLLGRPIASESVSVKISVAADDGMSAFVVVAEKLVPSAFVPVTLVRTIVGAVSSIHVCAAPDVMWEYPEAHPDTLLSVPDVHVTAPTEFATAAHASHVFGEAPEL